MAKLLTAGEADIPSLSENIMVAPIGRDGPDETISTALFISMILNL